MKSLKEIKKLKDKKVILRVDFNVPIGKDGVVDKGEDWRIRATLPTIEYLVKKGAKIILLSHLGRPDGKVVEEFRLGPVQDRLSELLGLSITKTPDCIGDVVKETIAEMKMGEIVLLENLRFHKEEEENGEAFAKELASLGDVYVNDAFSASHRAHASVHGITKYLPSYAGLLMEKEVDILTDAINNPKKPATIVIGGAKAETKLPVIKFLMDKFDNILVGGVVANVILKAKGIDTGKSLLGDMDPEEAKKIDLDNTKLHIPVDVIICNSEVKTAALSAIGKIGDERILDIGPDTAELYAKIISESKMIIWNGPMGLFEKDAFSQGTKEIAKAITSSKGYSIIGGGDTITALDKFGYLEKASYVSTGGGAMLEFMSGEKLPGIEALN
ncbi:MAG: phosphoglycerate kinase [Candidatus Paceibacterota bacterium]|jgi:phosphoglycerate kinase